MKLEYINGRRVTKFVHEMSPFEAAIERYEALAKQNHELQRSSPKSTDQQRQKSLAESLRHLENEKRHLANMGAIEDQLEEYRQAGMKAVTGEGNSEKRSAIKMMLAEKHHPTAMLEKYMRAEGVPKPSPYHTAHHIAPRRGRLKLREATQIRTHLHTNGIRINDPANGVYLVSVDDNTPHWSMPNSRGHRKYHTNDYERWLAQNLLHVKGGDHLKTRLQVIGRILQDNEPKAVHAQLRPLNRT